MKGKKSKSYQISAKFQFVCVTELVKERTHNLYLTMVYKMIKQSCFHSHPEEGVGKMKKKIRLAQDKLFRAVDKVLLS